MHRFGKRLLRCLACAAAILPAWGLPAHAIDPQFELDPQVLDSTFPAARQNPAAKHAAPPRHKMVASPSTRYRVRPGDTLNLILMGRYGFSEREAEAMIPRVKQLNGISDIHALQVGRTITIPTADRQGKGHGRSRFSQGDSGKMAAQQFRLVKVRRRDSRGDLTPVRLVWDRLHPAPVDAPEGIELKGENFNLSLDPVRFPVLPAADGGKILLDPGGKLPPLVKSLVQGVDEEVRVVSDDPANVRRFYASLLAAARFYSVEEDFSVDFGTDPRLTVTSDFRIEKDAESLMKQDLVLLNVSEARSGMPASLVSFLSGQGFQVIEPYTTYTRDATVELFGPMDSGLRLDIRADRFFEFGGERFIISDFNGDPVFYTLMRLLETRGYRVVILEERDDFRRVGEKLLTQLRLPGSFATQRLWPAQDIPYTVQLSGFSFRDPSSGDRVVLTPAELDPLVSELVTLNGYTVFRPR
ncbi:MAG: LysM peptidoglycan-binding domain-containing protein [Geobacter sp.]|nr:LysM peptidoglycan-binding domain-containing protein [Geobacter sp.]